MLVSGDRQGAFRISTSAPCAVRGQARRSNFEKEQWSQGVSKIDVWPSQVSQVRLTDCAWVHFDWSSASVAAGREANRIPPPRIRFPIPPD